MTAEQAQRAIEAGAGTGESRRDMLLSSARVRVENRVVPAPFIASLGAVQAFVSRTQPGARLNVGVPGTDVRVYYYGTTYVIVGFERVSSSPGTLGCANESSYRVTRSTGGVLQFDGCVEPHRRVLPTFSQLPPD